jgi:hypothetical protein
MSQIGDEAPYFSITATIYGHRWIPGEHPISHDGKRWWLHTSGCCHSEISSAFPELRPFVRWHLVSQDGPMHYTPNAIFWAEHMAGVSRWSHRPYDPDPETAFCNTVAFGAVVGDTMPDLAVRMTGPDTAGTVITRETVRAAVETWCAARYADLMSAFRRDMDAARHIDLAVKNSTAEPPSGGASK